MLKGEDIIYVGNRWFGENKKARLIQERISGSILFGMGAYIAANEINSINK